MGPLIHGDPTMSTITRPARVSRLAPEGLGQYLMTVDEFERIADGLDKPVELIEGLLVAKVTKKPPHVIATENVRDELMRIVSTGWRVMIEAPVRIPEYNEPEPDAALARGSKKDYVRRHPGPADLALVVEVSHRTLVNDRKLIGVYGPAGIPVYWIVNLDDRQVEVYAGPRRGGYKKPRIFKPGQSVPVVINGAEVGRIAVADILPPERSAETNKP